MSILVKLDKSAQDFILGLANTNLGMNPSTTVALARSLAYTLPLVPAESGDVIGSYRLEHRIKVEQILSLINELIIVDIKTILTLVESFYCFRMEQAYPSANIILISQETAVSDFFKISKYFSKDNLAIIANDVALVSRLCNGFSALIKQL